MSDDEEPSGNPNGYVRLLLAKLKEKTGYLKPNAVFDPKKVSHPSKFIQNLPTNKKKKVKVVPESSTSKTDSSKNKVMHTNKMNMETSGSKTDKGSNTTDVSKVMEVKPKRKLRKAVDPDEIASDDNYRTLPKKSIDIFEAQKETGYVKEIPSFWNPETIELYKTAITTFRTAFLKKVDLGITDRRKRPDWMPYEDLNLHIKELEALIKKREGEISSNTYIKSVKEKNAELKKQIDDSKGRVNAIKTWKPIRQIDFVISYSDHDVDEFVKYLNSNLDVPFNSQLRDVMLARQSYMKEQNKRRENPIRNVHLAFVITPNEIYVNATWEIVRQTWDWNEMVYSHFVTQYGLGKFGDKKVNTEFKSQDYKDQIAREEAERKSDDEKRRLKDDKKREKEEAEKEKERIRLHREANPSKATLKKRKEEEERQKERQRKEEEFERLWLYENAPEKHEDETDNDYQLRMERLRKKKEEEEERKREALARYIKMYGKEKVDEMLAKNPQRFS